MRRRIGQVSITCEWNAMWMLVIGFRFHFNPLKKYRKTERKKSSKCIAPCATIITSIWTRRFAIASIGGVIINLSEVPLFYWLEWFLLDLASWNWICFAALGAFWRCFPLDLVTNVIFLHMKIVLFLRISKNCPAILRKFSEWEMSQILKHPTNQLIEIWKIDFAI